MTLQKHAGDGTDKGKNQTAYVAPQIRSFSPAEFLELIGPAQGYGGGGSSDQGGQKNSGIGGSRNRLFPGLR